MAIDLEQQLKEFLASVPQNKHIIQVVEISHSAMTKTYYLWREPYTGSVTLDDDSVVVVEPLNIDITLPETNQTLDQAFTFSIDTVNVNDEFRNELDLIPLDTTEKILIVYREYLSDNLLEPQATVNLQTESIAYNKGVATMSAVSPRLNITRTGELYTYKRFPMLRGFL